MSRNTIATVLNFYLLKSFFLFLLLFHVSGKSLAQQISFPKGAYMNLQDIINRQPSEDFESELRPVNPHDTYVFYYLSPLDEKLQIKIINDSTLAYSDGTDLYINGYSFGLNTGFSRVIYRGKYLVFDGGVSKGEINHAASQGAIFGLAGATIGAGVKSSQNHIYVLESSTGAFRRVTDTYMNFLLRNHHQLFSEYQKEKQKKSREVIIKYLVKLNQAIEY